MKRGHTDAHQTQRTEQHMEMGSCAGAPCMVDEGPGAATRTWPQIEKLRK